MSTATAARVTYMSGHTFPKSSMVWSTAAETATCDVPPSDATTTSRISSRSTATYVAKSEPIIMITDASPATISAATPTMVRQTFVIVTRPGNSNAIVRAPTMKGATSEP